MTETRVRVLTPEAAPALIADVKDTVDAKLARALRPFHVALGSIADTAVDVALIPGDSITEGASATGSGAWEKRYANVLQDTLRRAVQPPGVIGGSGYFGFGSSLILSGAGFIGGSGTLAVDYTAGLGLKGVLMGNAAQWSFYFVGTACDLLYSTDPAYGSFTVTVDGVAQGGTTNCSGAASHGNKKRLTAAAVGTHTVVVTATGNVLLEGEMPYNGDELAGLRVWEGGHSGYGAHDFQLDTSWADSLTAIPNPKLVVVSGSSNDYYAGRSVAQSKTDHEANIALLRSKIAGDFSLVLLSYFDRPVGGGVTTDWQDFVDMYDELADGDDLIAHVNLGPDFGHKISDTDTRGGLVNNIDYVHPTNAGHKVIGKRIASIVMPEGAEGSGGVFNNVPDASKVVSAPQAAADLLAAAGLPYVAIGAFAGGAMSFVALPLSNFSLTANGSLTLAPSGMPVVAAGRTARFFVRITQDATGGRNLTLDAAIKVVGTFAINTTAAAVTLVELFWDGVSWWAFNRSDPAVGTTEAAAIAAVTGDQQAVYAAAFAGGAITLSGFAAAAYGAYRLVLGGNVTFSATAKPTIAAGRTYTFRMVLVQDATGSRTLTLNANVLTAAGVDPVLSTAPNAIDVLDFLWTGTELICTNFVKGAA